jgi:pyruvate kinase
MALYWGVRPLPFERLGSTDDMIDFAERRLLELGICSPGEAVVMLAGVPPNEHQSTNLMKLHRLRE